MGVPVEKIMAEFYLHSFPSPSVSIKMHKEIHTPLGLSLAEPLWCFTKVCSFFFYLSKTRFERAAVAGAWPRLGL